MKILKTEFPARDLFEKGVFQKCIFCVFPENWPQKNRDVTSELTFSIEKKTSI